MHLPYRPSVNKVINVFSFPAIVSGGQCSSYEKLDTTPGNCQQLVYDSAVGERWFKLKCYLFSGCRASWCQHVTSCLGKTREWKRLCKWYFYRYPQFNITSGAGEINSSPVRFNVKLCDKKWFYKIYTITVTEYKSGSGNSKNGLYDLLFIVTILTINQ